MTKYDLFLLIWTAINLSKTIQYLIIAITRSSSFVDDINHMRKHTMPNAVIELCSQDCYFFSHRAFEILKQNSNDDDERERKNMVAVWLYESALRSRKFK